MGVNERRHRGVGEIVAARELVSISGEQVTVPAAAAFTHLQFRRFAGCPFCNLHLRSIADRYDEIREHGILEVAVFHSAAEKLREYNEPQPFPVIADPERSLYKEFGVEPSLSAVLSPRSWGPLLRGLARKQKPLSVDPGAGPLGLPADFLIDAQGRIVAVKYGSHAYDQWSVEELLAVASSVSPT